MAIDGDRWCPVVLTAVLVVLGARPVTAQTGFPGSTASVVAARDSRDHSDTVSTPTAAEELTEDAPSASGSDTTQRTAAVIAAASPGPLPSGSEVFPDDIKFLGGAGFPDMKGRESWDNSLVITPDSIVAEFADSAVPRTAIPLTALTQCLYGQAATRHVGAWVAAGVLIAPIALLGILHKSRNHFVNDLLARS